jgi:hypothetical protein
MSEPSHATAQIIVATTPTGQSELIVRIQLDCPRCGPQQILLAGHHLRLIRDVLIETIDDYPELTQAEYQQIGPTQKITSQGNDPSTS